MCPVLSVSCSLVPTGSLSCLPLQHRVYRRSGKKSQDSWAWPQRPRKAGACRPANTTPTPRERVWWPHVAQNGLGGSSFATIFPGTLSQFPLLSVSTQDETEGAACPLRSPAWDSLQKRGAGSSGSAAAKQRLGTQEGSPPCTTASAPQRPAAHLGLPEYLPHAGGCPKPLEDTSEH